MRDEQGSALVGGEGGQGDLGLGHRRPRACRPPRTPTAGCRCHVQHPVRVAPLTPRRRRAAPRRNRGEQAAAVEVVLVPQPCHKHRSSPVVSGQQGSLVLRHESSADALLSWTNGHMSWSVRGAGDGNRTRMASLASWFYGALLTTEALPAVSAGGRCLRGRLRSSRRTPGGGPQSGGFGRYRTAGEDRHAETSYALGVV